MSRLRPTSHHGTPKTSKKTRAQKKAIQDWRDEFVRIVGQCELCNRNYSLFCHEISRGVNRSASLNEPACILVLCNAPHGIKQSCHGEVGLWAPAKQMALLYLRRPGDYNLERFCEVVKQRPFEQSDVDGWIVVLTGIRKPQSERGE